MPLTPVGAIAIKLPNDLISVLLASVGVKEATASSLGMRVTPFLVELVSEAVKTGPVI